MQSEGPVDRELALLVQVLQHQIRVARVFDSQGGLVLAAPPLLCCTSCGAFAWGGVRDLLQPCKAGRAGTGLRQQKMRISRGLFPRWLSQYEGWTVSALEVPSPPDLCQLAATVLNRSKHAAPCSRAVFPGGARPRLGKGALLARFGLELLGLAQWIARATSKRDESLEEEAPWA